MIQATLPPNEMVDLARDAIVAAVSGAKVDARRFGAPKGVFVTIEVDGTIRGCRGSLKPLTRSLASEIVEAARSAAVFDPRYQPVRREELSRLSITVTIVGELVPVSAVEGIPPSEGIVLQSGGRTGVVLPWEGKDPKTRLEWAYRKAGVKPGSPVTLYRMKGERYRG